jgi:pyruvate/2-oxoglutarate dehydrogenase complex dihydrolipoamide dehydrogenase (E3) component
MKHYDIVIIGGGAGGISVLKGCYRLYKKKSMALIKKDDKTLIPCAIPYVYGELGGTDNDLVSNEIVSKLGADLICDEVEYIDHRNKVLKIKNSQAIEYEKLVLATGSNPIVPNIKGSDKSNVFYVKKDVQIIGNLDTKIKNSYNIVIIGGGYIGVEFAEHIKEYSPEKNVTIVESASRCLSANLDLDLTDEIEAKLRYVGINILKGVSAKEFVGENSCYKVKLSDKTQIDCDLVIVGVGSVPECSLANNSGIDVSKNGIVVDSYMRTSAKDVFACGDCIVKHSFFNSDISNVRLASLATYEGRILSENLYKNCFVNKGVVGVFTTKIHDKVFSSCGYNLEKVKNEEIGFFIGESEVANRHPSSLGGCAKIKVRLIFNEVSKVLIGAQISGPEGVSELINVLSLAIERGVDVYGLYLMQVATHPKVSASPIASPIISATEDALKRIS